MRKILIITAVIIAALAVLLITAKMSLQPLSDETLRARYAPNPSDFITIDGVPLHYKDEGQGPVVILLHGSYGSLSMWNDWAALLTPDYRVIRFDIPPIGLSGPDPTGEYGYERAQELLDGLGEELNLTEFDLAGTSVGGAVAFRYAAENPSRVKRLIIAGAPMVPLSEDAKAGRGLPMGFAFANWFSVTFLDRYKTELHQKLFLEHLFYDDTKVTPAIAKEYADFGNREGNLARGMTFTRNSQTTDDTADILASITVPTLVMWCDSSPVLPLSHGEAGAKLLTATPAAFVVVPECGHIIPLEKGPETARIAKQFLNGELPQSAKTKVSSAKGS